MLLTVDASWARGLAQMHDTGATGAGVTVAIVDTAVSSARTHIDQIWPNTCGGDADTDDGVLAWHATSVARIVSSIAPDARIEAHPVGTARLDGTIACSTDRTRAFAQAVNESADADVIVVTSSVGRSPELDAAVIAAQLRGATIVAARPQTSVSSASWLFDLPGVIGVQAVDASGVVPDQLAADDPDIDVSAQGVGMPVLGMRWMPGLRDGTSFAAPVVAGLIAANRADASCVLAAAAVGSAINPATASLLAPRAQSPADTAETN